MNRSVWNDCPLFLTISEQIIRLFAISLYFRNFIALLLGYTGRSVSSPRLLVATGVSTINKQVVFGTLFLSFIVYSSQVYTRGTDVAHGGPMNDEARTGQQVYQEYNCVACHQFYGLGGYMGPDLTNVISNRGAAYARAFISSGTAQMPNFDLSEAEVTALVSYLEFVDQTGTYPLKEYDVQWTGIVAQADDPK